MTYKEECESLRRELAEARQEIADLKADCETGHDQDEATIAELRRQLKHMTDQYNAALEAEQVRYRQVVENDAEIERLKRERLLTADAVETLSSAHKEKLAASLLQNTQLRELIDKVNGKLLAATMCHPNAVEVLVEEAYQVTTKALALPTDTSALEAIKAEVAAKAGEVMRERCAQSGMLVANNGIETAGAIRAIPVVTLEDLKCSN